MTARHGRHAFTLVEILIVVLILGILAALVIPRYTDTTDETQESAVRAQLRTVRSQIQFFRNREGDFPDDLQALVTAGYLSELPPHPGPGDWVYDATTGALSSDQDGTW